MYISSCSLFGDREGWKREREKKRERGEREEGEEGESPRNSDRSVSVILRIQKNKVNRCFVTGSVISGSVQLNALYFAII